LFTFCRALTPWLSLPKHFPALGGNCALKASTFINTLVLSQHKDGECLNDTVHIAKDKALRLVTNQKAPTPQTIGTWLRRLGKDNQGVKALQKVTVRFHHVVPVLAFDMRVYTRSSKLLSVNSRAFCLPFAGL
jgi:hypothetical protein